MDFSLPPSILNIKHLHHDFLVNFEYQKSERQNSRDPAHILYYTQQIPLSSKIKRKKINLITISSKGEYPPISRKCVPLITIGMGHIAKSLK